MCCSAAPPQGALLGVACSGSPACPPPRNSACACRRAAAATCRRFCIHRRLRHQRCLLSNSPHFADTPLGGSATPAADEQLTAAELEEAASLAAAKASAAAHFGGSTHATAPSAAGQQPGAEEGEGEEEPAAAIGHSLVKPVDEDKGDASGSGQQTVQQPVQQKAASAAAEDDLEEGEGEPPQAQATQPRKAGEETPRTGHTMVQPVAGDAEEEQEEKTGQQQQQHEEEQQAQQQEAQQQEQQEGSAAAGGGSGVKAQEQQEVAVITRSEEAAEAAGVQEGGWEALTSSGYKQAMSRSGQHACCLACSSLLAEAASIKQAAAVPRIAALSSH